MVIHLFIKEIPPYLDNNMRIVYKIFVCILLLGVGHLSLAQDINYSQFYEMPLLRNPALAGLFTGDIRIAGAYRSQWQSVTTPYQTMALGSEIKLSMGNNTDDFLTLGLQLSNDQAGDSKLSRTQIFPALNYHKLINSSSNSYISAGIMAGAVQQRFDPSKLQFDDQFVNGSFTATNPTRQSFLNTNLTYWDVGAGLSFSTEIGSDVHYYIGAALYHFTHPKVAFTAANDVVLNEKFVFNAGMSAATSDYDKVILYGDYFRQGGNSQVQGGILFSHDLTQYDEDNKITLTGGAVYRWNDAVIPVVKLDYFKLAIGLSYDVNVSKLKSASQMRGGMELTLSYKSYLNILSSSLNKTRCPSF